MQHNLRYAILHNALTDCARLAKRISDINKQDSKGNTFLIIAVYYNKPDACQILLEYDADPNIKNNNGQYPFHLAAYFGNYRICEMFTKFGANPFIRDQKNTTPLIRARRCINISNKCVALLERYEKKFMTSISLVVYHTSQHINGLDKNLWHSILTYIK